MGFIDKLFGVTKLDESLIEAESTVDHLERAVDAAKEIHESAMINMLNDLESENTGWRSIGTSNDSIRDFTTDMHRELSRMAWSAVMTNPIAAREIFYKTVFVAGKGLRCTSQIPEIMKVLDEFWTATRNKIPYHFPMYINRYNIDGECFFALFVEKQSGKVTLRDIEPQEITEILYDPDDVAVPVYFRRQFVKTIGAKGTNSGTEMKDIWYKSVDCIQHPQLEEEVKLPDNAKIAGDDEKNIDIFIFHFKNGLLTNRRRGLSTLTNHLPWLREYKDILRMRTGINKARSTFFLDVTMKNATRLQIQEEANKHKSPPRPNTCVVHGDDVIYTFMTPNIQGTDVASDLSEIKNMSAIGSMLPPDLLGESGKSNYQNSGRSKFPFVRSMEFQQELWEYALKYGIMWVVVWAATEYGELPTSFKVAKKLSLSSLALTQEGELYNTETLAIQNKKTIKIVKDYLKQVMEAAAVPGNDITSLPAGAGRPPMPGMQPQAPPPIPGGDPAKAESMMDDYVVITMSEEVDAVDLIDVQFPRIDTENLGDMAMAFQAFDAMKIVSKRTLAKLAGFDYEKEKELVAQETAEAMKTMEDQQAKLAANGGGGGMTSPGGPMGGPMGEDASAMGGPPGTPMQTGQNNEAGNIQAVLADILNRPGRAKKRGPINESRLIVAHKLVEAFLVEE